MATKAQVPDTSTTLLRDVADSQHARWAEFYARYQPMMAAYLRSHFPSLDSDDIVQETFAALAKALPGYVYNPKETGHFRNYLTGVLRYKALDALAAKKRNDMVSETVAAETDGDNSLAEEDYRKWRESVYEIALQQLLADEMIHDRTKQMFIRLAIDGEKPEAVAESFGVPYNTVIKMKERTLARLRGYVEAMKSV